MQAFRNNRVKARMDVNLKTLRKSTVWATAAHSSNDGAASTHSSHVGHTSVLALRLEEILILEIRKEGATQYMNMNVRALYKYVLTSITSISSHVSVRTMNSEGNTVSLLSKNHGELGNGTDKQNEEDSNDEEAIDEVRPLRPKRPLRTPTNDRPGRTRGQRKPTNALTYRELLGAYLHPRDMRRLVTPFSASNRPGIIVRRHVMLLNFDPLRAVILRDRILVLVPNGADSFLVDLERRVLGIGGDSPEERFMMGADASVHDGHSTKTVTPLNVANSEVSATGSVATGETEIVFADDEADESTHNKEYNEWEDMERREWINVSFELVCVDAVLTVVCSILTSDTLELQKTILDYIHQIDGGDSSKQTDEDPLTVIRAIKDAVREMDSRVKGFIQSMGQILDDEEDMALMNLSRLLTHPERFIQPVPQNVLEEESDEPELILEAHVQTAYTLENVLDLIQGQINTASEEISQKLDAVRNRLLYANMVVSVANVCVATGAFIGSMFGMNVTNHIEDEPRAFVRIFLWTVIGCTLVGVAIMVLLIKSGTIPWRPRRGLLKDEE